ncbi:unnamed protein product [Brachionus calyciflorus]|uniref:CCZ1/INTU second Longin domain-containing protein n=1 Tax=Brachionus calyciflorus TaxID=104777 RepID=A0A813VIP0_9BILA|nr:unnamed protein product [Brachionus calyciflorus]
MTDTRDKLFINENGVISLEVREDSDLELTNRLYINTSNNLKLEIKYPNLNKLNSTFLLGENYLKLVNLKVKPKKSSSQTSLCNCVLGIYPNLAYDPIKKVNNLVIQGFVPHKILFYQHVLKIGDLILSINDIEVTYENIESLLASIKKPQNILIKALSPITYANLNTLDIILRNEFSELVKIKENKNVTLAHSKSTSIVKGDRVKALNQSLTNDDLFFYAMILSLDQETLKKKQSSKEKSDLIYVYPSEDCKFTYRKQSNIILSQLVEAIRGLFMTLSYAVKDIDQTDQAVYCTIDYQGQVFNVSFLHENYGNKGLLVILAPSDQINIHYFKILSKNLNETYKFTFGSSTLTNLIFLDDDLESKKSTKTQLDTFFNNFHRRLLQSTQFNFFDSTYASPNLPKQILNYQEKTKCYNEMRSKIFDSIPFFELPHGLKIDLETLLSDLESQDFIGLNGAKDGHRRNFYVIGSCLFFQNYLLVSHFDEMLTKQVFNFCDHYNLFDSLRNGNKNHFRIWKEIELNNKKNGERHFLIIVSLRDFMAAMIIEAGGRVAKEIDENKIVKPNPLYIQKLLHMLLDLNNSGLMLEVNQHFSSMTSKIIFNFEKFVIPSKKRAKLILKKRSNTRSPIRSKDQIKRVGRSLSRNVSPSPSQGFKQSTENLAKDSSDEASIDEFDQNNEKIYQTRSLSRQNSITDLGRVSMKSGNFIKMENDNKVFNDLSLTNSILYYAGTETKTNGILFIPKNFDLNSSLFTRFFSNYVKACFKIKNLFENFSKMEEKFGKNDKCFEIVEQGVLFDLFMDDEKTKTKQKNDDKSKMKEFNFWVVGRRKLQRVDTNSEWINLGDFFVCFHDNLEDIILELAFDIGCAKMNY